MDYHDTANDLEELDFDFYEKIGMFLDNNGNLKEMNAPLFAEHLCRKYRLLLHKESVFYTYRDNHYQQISERGLKRRIYRYVNDILDNGWTLSLEAAYFPAIIRGCKGSERLKSSNDYINVENGLLRITGKWGLQPHNSKIFSTTQLPITYSADHVCPRFDAFIQDIFDGDRDLIRLVQEIMGYCLCDSTQAQKLFFFYGIGSNGKSVLCKVLEQLVGIKNVTHITLRGFSDKFEVADILDKKLNIAPESDTSNHMIRTDKLKQISAGDTFLLQGKYDKPFSYQPTAKLIFSVNTLPKTLDTSQGFIRRLCIVPFKKQYSFEPVPGKSLADTELFPKLMEELGGILNFALEGLRRLQANEYRFTKARQSEDALWEYLPLINPYIDFVKENIVTGPNQKVPRKAVYEVFKEWSYRQGFTQCASISAKEFYPTFLSHLEEEGICAEATKSKGIRMFTGISLQESARPHIFSRT